MFTETSGGGSNKTAYYSLLVWMLLHYLQRV
jgi:hypothetical protein